MSAANTSLPLHGYVPILKSKASELGALKETTSRDALLPLVEALSVQHASTIATSWNDPTHALLVQPINLEGTDDGDWADSVGVFFDELRDLGVSAVPVVTLDDGPETLAAIAVAVARDQRGVAIRLEGEDLQLESAAAIQQDLDDVFAALGVAPDDCDVIIDCGLVRSSIGARVLTANAVLSQLPYVASLRNVIVTFSAFPDDVGQRSARGAITTFPRDDSVAYQILIGRALPRVPIYSDLGVGTPSAYYNVPFPPIPLLRYTAGDEWVIFRGMTRTAPAPQYVQLCQDLAAAPIFAGTAFSYGDAYTHTVATGACGPGNAMTHLRAAINHHVAYVLNRLATTGAP